MSKQSVNKLFKVCCDSNVIECDDLSDLDSYARKRLLQALIRMTKTHYLYEDSDVSDDECINEKENKKILKCHCCVYYNNTIADTICELCEKSVCKRHTRRCDYGCDTIVCRDCISTCQYDEKCHIRYCFHCNHNCDY